MSRPDPLQERINQELIKQGKQIRKAPKEIDRDELMGRIDRVLVECDVRVTPLVR